MGVDGKEQGRGAGDDRNRDDESGHALFGSGVVVAHARVTAGHPFCSRTRRKEPLMDRRFRPSDLRSGENVAQIFTASADSAARLHSRYIPDHLPHRIFVGGSTDSSYGWIRDQPVPFSHQHHVASNAVLLTSSLFVASAVEEAKARRSRPAAWRLAPGCVRIAWPLLPGYQGL